MVISLRELHKKAIQKLHSNVGAKVKVKFSNGDSGYVLATLSDEKTTTLINGNYVEKDIISFCIMKQNLMDSNLPLKGFISLEYIREKYEVLNTNESSTLGNSLVINCKKVG